MLFPVFAALAALVAADGACYLPPAKASSSASAISSKQSSALSTASASIKPTTTSSVVVSTPTASNAAGCASGVHIIVARGSLEQQGEGLTGSLANNITARIPNSDSVGLVYPAVLFPYFDSENAGVHNLTVLLQQFNTQCPNTRFVLLGWSQGAQVILDTLCGGSEEGFNQSVPIDTKYTRHMVGAIMYGDPSHKQNQPYDRGTATRDGIFNRVNTAACLPYAPRLASYCDDFDTYCTNSNSSGLATHFGYFDKYNQDATNFIVNLYNTGSGL